VSFYQRSLALFFGELAGPPVAVADARDTVEGETVKGLRIEVRELGYASFWYVRNRMWHVARPGAVPQRTVVPGNAVIYQVGTEVVGDLLRIVQAAYLSPDADRARVEAYVRGYEGFLQHNIPQGLASLKAHEGVERARALLEELRREHQARLAGGRDPEPPAPAAAVPEPAREPMPEPPQVEEPAVTEPPAAEPVTVTPQTTAGFVFDQALVSLLGRLGTAYPWLLPDYGRQGDGMGVRVTLPAGLSVVFTHAGDAWTATASTASGPLAQGILADDDAVTAWAVARIREIASGHAARIGAERPADAAQLFQRVADLS